MMQTKTRDGNIVAGIVVFAIILLALGIVNSMFAVSQNVIHTVIAGAAITGLAIAV
jgi:hypothetical protein